MLINDLLSVWRQGKSLTSAAAWSNTAAAGAALTGVLTGALHIARSLGYELPGVTDAQLEAIAGGVAAVVCVVSGFLHVAANPAAGLPPKGGTGADGGAGPGLDAERPVDRF